MRNIRALSLETRSEEGMAMSDDCTRRFSFAFRIFQAAGH
jgi:hypothetical protein